MIEKVSRKIFGQLVEVVLEGGAYRATKYLSPKLTVKVTRQHKIDRRDRQVELRLTIGEPNYAERVFIKKCKAAGEPFPVRKIQIKWSKK